MNYRTRQLSQLISVVCEMAAILTWLSKRTWYPHNVWLTSIFVKMWAVVMQEVKIIPGQGPLHTQECLNSCLSLCFDRKSPSATFKLCQEFSGATAATFNQTLLQNGSWLLDSRRACVDEINLLLLGRWGAGAFQHAGTQTLGLRAPQASAPRVLNCLFVLSGVIY